MKNVVRMSAATAARKVKEFMIGPLVRILPVHINKNV